ncbi:dihydroneopterin aldolase [Sphingobacterium hungaricum]|uniref:7,8-dihydroneopterin aldolase n=1 Tax=Sphingobacterium hungaricum TaxID=2082723 RepID=A0A928YRM0_9SPHI|nr:dihydroneopterin aldolase [Sphingobacterium hungaricum]MBE8714315.1 dihydroneopterin aldolase [Sphingobacterium hungaricum]
MATITQTVSLVDARFFSPIGFYPEEQILGNEFFVTVSVSFPFVNEETEELTNTLNYEKLYEVVSKVMSPKRKLLESAAEEILKAIISLQPTCQRAHVKIKKSNPPFGGDLSSSQVELHYEN